MCSAAKAGYLRKIRLWKLLLSYLHITILCETFAMSKNYFHKQKKIIRKERVFCVGWNFKKHSVCGT